MTDILPDQGRARDIAVVAANDGPATPVRGLGTSRARRRPVRKIDPRDESPVHTFRPSEKWFPRLPDFA